MCTVWDIRTRIAEKYQERNALERKIKEAEDKGQTLLDRIRMRELDKEISGLQMAETHTLKQLGRRA